MKYDKKEIVEYINSLKGYEGYVQFSDRPIENIWSQASDISIEQKEGFVYEAHFCNSVESISIKQLNAEWYVSKTPLSEIDDAETDIKTFFAFEKNVKMAQIWKEEPDTLCEGMMVKKLKKVVFTGFVGGEK